MAETKVLTTSQYAKLVADIRKLVAEGRASAEEAAKNVLVQTYWQIGKRIVGEGLTQNASYGESVIEDLADELEVDERTLYHSVAFFNAYKVSPRAQNLTWSHYRALIGVKDDSVRLLLEEKADKEEWTRDQLTKAIRSEAKASSGKKGGKKFRRPTEATYVYKGIVDKVIDGDTLILRIDLGFQVWKDQRIRLADIDCPAMDEDKGREAFAFVRDQMAKTEFVMVKTNKIDIYGRYVGHIFYSLTEGADRVKVFEEGRYLNQELVEKGLAALL